MQKASNEITHYFQQMTQWVVQMMIINKLQEAWREAVNYATEYYDALNEIRVVTGMTQEEADVLGESYRQMAQEMNLTSTEIAKSAVDIYRQGYGSAADVAGVSKGASVFGAITSMDTDKAMETMTAALQNFQQDGETMEHLAFRIADSWSYLGDAVATEASDIGTAMSKVAGSAVNVGLSLEQTSAWAAVVMAKTQESAETIGTSLNSMITRYTKLTAGGFNSIITDEDGEEVAYNDVAKALQKVGIATYTASEGFRDYGVVMDELGAKWKDLTAAEQNYIAFQMAGTRNMNRFITLMNGYEEATRLTGEALNSSGVAMEKYSVWMETVEAAQNNLQNSLEDLYALLLDGSVVRGFYTTMASLVDVFNEGTEAAGGLNIILPAAAAGIALVTVGVKALGAAISDAGGKLALIQAHPVIAIATAFGALVTVATLAGKAIDYFAKADERAAEATKTLAGELTTERASMKKLAGDIGSLENVSEPTAENVDTLKNAITQLSTAAPDLATKFNLDASAVDNFSGSVGNAKKALEEYLKTERYSAFKEARAGSADAEKTYQNAFSALYGSGNNKVYGVTEAIDTVADAEKQIEWIEGMIADSERKIREALAAYGDLLGISADDILSRSMSADDVASIKEALIGDLPAAEGMIRSVFDSPDGVWSQKSLIESLNDELVVARAKLEEITRGAKQQIQEAAQVAITEALNPKTYDELSFSDLLDIEQFMGGLDYSQMDWGEVQDLAKTIANKYQETFKDAIRAANMNMALADELGMGDAIYRSMLTDLNNPELVELRSYFEQLFRPYLDSWEKTKRSFAAQFREENLNDLIAAGFDTENLLSMIQTNLSGDLPDGTTMQDVIDEILAYDPNESGMSRENWIKKVLDQRGIETKQSLTDLEAVLKAGNDAINKQLQEIGKQKIANGGYKDIFEGLLGGGSVHETSMALARDVLGVNATEEAVTAYAKEIVEAFVGANPLIANAIDTTTGTIKEGSSGIVEALKDMDVSEVLNELLGTSTDGDARAVIGEYIEGITTLQEAQQALDTALSSEKGSEKYTEALETIAAYTQIPIEALGDLSLAQEIISSDMEEVNGKLLAMANTMLQVGDLKFDENGEIVSATGETNNLVSAMQVLLQFCEYEIGEDGLFAGINAQALTAIDSVSALASLVSGIREEREDNKASRDGYNDQLQSLQEAYGENGAAGLGEAFEDLDEDIKNGIADTYPELLESIYEVVEGTEDAEKAAKKMGKEFEKAAKRANAKNFKKTADALGDLETNSISVEDAFDTLWSEMDDLNDASEAFSELMTKGFTEDTTDELDTLATYLGTTSDILQQNWDASGISNALAQASAEGQSYLAALQDAALIEFVMHGRSDIDLSQARGQLISTENLAQSTIDKLVACGAFTVDELAVKARAAVWNPSEDGIGGTWSIEEKPITTQVLRPAAGNPLGSGTRTGGSGGGGGGGGGGGSSKRSVSKKTQKKLDEIDNVKELYDYRLKLVDLAKEYYEATGEIEGLKAYTEQEIDIRKQQAHVMRDYIEQLKGEIAAKESAMAKNKKSSKAYKQAAVDLEALQEKLMDVAEAYAEAETSLVELTEAMEEFREEQRQTRISVEDMIRKVLEEEEDAAREMLEGRKDVEDEILGILEERYEKQKDLEIEALEASIEAAEARQEAIEAEIDALDEALEKRRELAEQAKEEQELAELEAKYARISADPTRAREALELYKEIQEMREEMAWNAAESEVESQKEMLEKKSEAIDEEIEDIEDEIDRIEEVFEELLKNPQKLIDEMLEIMKKTDSEIIKWLKENNEEFAKSTATTQEQMVTEWQEMLNQMHGYTETYEKQIEEILSWTDEEILKWMQTHSTEFSTATEAQQESFLHGWKTTLKEWRDAYKEVADEIIDLSKKTTNTTKTTTTSSGSSSSGSSSSSKSTASTSSTTTTPKKMFEQSGTGYGTATKAKLVQMVEGGVTYIKANDGKYWYKLNDAESTSDNKYYTWYGDKRYVKKYARGGLVDYTGMAWMDGTSSKPERVLDWKQNMLFESLVKTLESMQNIRIPVPQFTMPAFGDYGQNAGDNGVNIENIVVQVEKLENDADYELMADKVGEVIGKRLAKGKAIGGIRIR